MAKPSYYQGSRVPPSKCIRQPHVFIGGHRADQYVFLPYSRQGLHMSSLVPDVVEFAASAHTEMRLKTNQHVRQNSSPVCAFTMCLRETIGHIQLNEPALC